MQAAPADSEYLPAEQFTQTVAAAAAEYLPAGQAAQASVPEVAAKVPAGQAVQAQVPLAPDRPAGHAPQGAQEQPSGPNCPAGHTPQPPQLVEPVEAWNLAVAQPVHAVAPAKAE